MSCRASAAILSGLLLLGGCAVLEGRSGPRASEEERRAYAAAVSQQADDPGAAERAFTEFLARYPSSVLADDAAKRLAEIAFDQGDEDLALRRFHEAVRDHPDSDSVDAVRIAIARLEYEQTNTYADGRITTGVWRMVDIFERYGDTWQVLESNMVDIKPKADEGDAATSSYVFHCPTS